MSSHSRKAEEVKGQRPMSKEKPQAGESAANSYQIRPPFNKKFHPNVAKEIIHSVLCEELGGKNYAADEVQGWCKRITDTVLNRLKETKLERYKFVVDVILGEYRGEGVRSGVRCLWDSDTDNYASDVFLNESMFCVASAYAIYYY